MTVGPSEPIYNPVPIQQIPQAQAAGGLAQPNTPTASTTPPPPPPAQPSHSGGGGLFGFIDKAAKAVGSFAGDVIDKIPGAQPVMAGLNRVYTDVVSHPLSTLMQISNMATFQHRGPGYFFQPSSWTQAWQQANHISPGQEVILAFNNGGAEGLWNVGTKIDPSKQDQVQALFQRNSAASVFSGATDALTRAYTDPVSIASKFGAARVSAFKNAPIRSGSAAEIETRLSSRGGQRLINQVAAAHNTPTPFTAISKLKAVQSSPQSYALTQALHAAGPDTAKISQVLKVAMGDQGALDELANDTQALEAFKAAGQASNGPLTLSQHLPAVPGQLAAMRLSQIMHPSDLNLKSALSDMSPSEFDQWFSTPAKLKSDHAQMLLATKLDELNNYKAVASSLLDRTTGDMGLIPAKTKAAAALSPRPLSGFLADVRDHPTNFVQQIVGHSADPLIRVYHSLSDSRPTQLVDFGDMQTAIPQLRSFLNTSSILEPAEKDAMLNDFATALKNGKGEAQTTFNKIERSVMQKTVDYFGLTPEAGNEIYSEFAARRGLYTQGVISRAYGALTGPEGEQMAVFPSHDASQVIVDPYLETQLAHGALPMADMRDYEDALRRMDNTGILDHVRTVGDAGHKMLTDSLENFYGLWKPVSMLTGHRVFNHVGDDFARSVVKIGGLAAAQNAAQGTWNLLRNATRPLTKNKTVRNLTGQWEQEVHDLQSSYDSLKTRYMAQQQQIAAGLKVADPNRISGEAVAQARQAVADKRAQPPTGIPPKHRLGEGTFRVPGTNLEYPEIFGGIDGPYLRQMLSANHTMSELFDRASSNDYNAMQTLADHDVITPSDGPKVHGTAILRYINNQLRNDPVAKMAYAGKTDTEISNWMKSTAEGRQRMKDMHIGNPRDNIEMVRDAIAKYLPTQYSRDIAFTRPFKPEDLQHVWPNASARPSVSGNMALLTHTGGPQAKFLQHYVSKLIQITGGMPDDILVRHPMANELYKSNITRLVNQAIGKGQEVKVGSEAYQALHKQAIAATKVTMQKTLYDTSRFVDAGRTLRFAIPFFNAWHNALSSWSHLIVQNPQLIARGLEAKHALWNAPFAVDTTTGQRANDNTPIDNLAFVMHMPKGLAKSVGLGDMSDVAVSAKTVVSPTYADSIGSPGFGPLVQVPVNHLVKEDPGLLNNPYVAQILGGQLNKNDLMSLLPSAATQTGGLLSAAGITTGSPQDAATLANLKWTLYQEQYYDYMAGKRSKPPNWNDIGNQALWLSAITGIVNRLMPLGFKPQDQYKFLTDQYQQMYQQDPKHADENFYDKYGTAGFIYTQSLGKNVAGVAPTMGAISSYEANKSLIKAHPELGSLIVGPDGNGAFNDLAYKWEIANGLRTKLSPEEAAKQNAANLGWVQYDKINANIQAQLTSRGLTSVNQSGAEDLKSLKNTFINATNNPSSKYYNPDWYTSYGSFNSNQYETRLQAIAQIAQDQTLLANPLRSDIRSLNQWVQYRDVIYEALQQRDSKSITSSSNQDLANWWDYWMSNLQQNDTKFGPLYARYLEKDNFKAPL